MVGSENSVLWSDDSLLFLRSLACRYYTLVIICMENIIMKNNLEHIFRGNMLDGYKRDISAWALRKLQYFWQPLYLNSPVQHGRTKPSVHCALQCDTDSLILIDE